MENQSEASIRQWADKGDFAHSSLMDFPPHQRPNVSRLEAFRSEIAAMRSSNWPFQMIAGWLRENRQLEVSKEAVRQFCNVRGIGKIPAPPLPISNRILPSTLKKPPVKFEYDESKPILTRRSDSQ